MQGVNLGNWLVLEKWMAPELFTGTDAEDEVDLIGQLDEVTRRERFTRHRDSYVTDRDFAYLAARGIDFVRLPVPYFVFGDVEGYLGCIEYVDKAFTWGERHGVQILVDLHTVPDSQNGFDNGGICGVCKFHRSPEHVEFALTVLERLAGRYRDRPNLWGIEVLNEPISPQLWSLLDVPRRYPAKDPAYAAGSEAVPTEFLKDFYDRAYRRIRTQAPDVRVVFHDGFRIAEWVGVLDDPAYTNITVDTHLYVMMAGQRDLDGYLEHIDHTFGDTLRTMAQHFPILVGEWCLDTKWAGLADLAGQERADYFRTIADAHLAAFEPALAWSYWSYKMHADDPGAEVWDLLRTVEKGYLQLDAATVRA